MQLQEFLCPLTLAWNTIVIGKLDLDGVCKKGAALAHQCTLQPSTA